MHQGLRLQKPSSWWGTRGMGRVAVCLLAMGALLLLGALVQQQFGIFGVKAWSLPSATKIRPDGSGFKIHLPAWGMGPLAEQRVVLLRDGKPVGMRVDHARTVVERGGGAYKIQREYLYFSLPKGQDPRPIVRSLSVQLPRRVKTAVPVAGLILLLAGALLASRNAHAQTLLLRARSMPFAMPNSWLVAGVFACALMVTLARLPEAVRFSDGFFSVKGVPYSDAVGWDELARNLAGGKGFKGGFSAQRPLYPVMLGMLYAVTGPSLLVAKALNAVWLAFAAAAVCAIGIAGGSRTAGLVAAVGVVIEREYVAFSGRLLTETSGVAYGAAAVLLLALAIERPVWWRIMLAGLLLACANLASGFGLLALLGYGAVALVTWWARQGARKAVWQSAMLAGVVAVAWTPWLIRQQAVHGVLNLSTSSANLMYATASPEYGHLTLEAGRAWQAAGVPNEEGARYKFYMDRYAEAVKAQPAAYIAHVLRSAETFADTWRFTGPDHFGVVLLGLVGSALFLLRKHRPLVVLASAVVLVALCFRVEGRSAEGVWPWAAVLALVTCPPRQRPLWALVALTAPAVALLAGMTGGHLGRRMWTACEWTMPLLLVAGGAGAMRMLATWVEAGIGLRLPGKPADAPTRQDPDDAMPAAAPGGVRFVSTVGGTILLAHAVLASLTTTGLHLLAHEDTTLARNVSAETRARAHELAALQFSFLNDLPFTDERYWIEQRQFGEYACRIDARRDEQHWARSFEVRAYGRTVAFAEPAGGSGPIACQWRAQPREIPRNTPLLLIGVLNRDAKARLGHDVNMVEVLGYVPVEKDGPAWPRATWLPFSREAYDIVRPRPRK